MIIDPKWIDRLFVRFIDNDLVNQSENQLVLNPIIRNVERIVI